MFGVLLRKQQSQVHSKNVAPHFKHEMSAPANIDFKPGMKTTLVPSSAWHPHLKIQEQRASPARNQVGNVMKVVIF